MATFPALLPSIKAVLRFLLDIFDILNQYGLLALEVNRPGRIGQPTHRNFAENSKGRAIPAPHRIPGIREFDVNPLRRDLEFVQHQLA
jgi:hypothetical protein